MTDIGPIYVIQYLGDLDKHPMVAHASLPFALAWLRIEFGNKETNFDGADIITTPDPEDDRIVIWEFAPGEIGKAVWHFSGWHWPHDAHDLPGGPLEQGKLPGFDKTLYELAVEDY